MVTLVLFDPECLAADGDTRVGSFAGAAFNVHGLERWRVGLRQPSCSRDCPFFLLNEVIGALACSGFSGDAQRIIDNAWNPDERKFLTSLARSFLKNEVSSRIRVSVLGQVLALSVVYLGNYTD